MASELGDLILYKQLDLSYLEELQYFWVCLDYSHTTCTVRLFGIRPEEVFTVVSSFRLLLLYRYCDAAFGELVRRYSDRGG